MQRARGIPILVEPEGSNTHLERIYLGQGTHSENWLQALIQHHPDILPVIDIEPAFGEIVPVAREVPCDRGFIDNLFMTPSGDIVLVETKLWRNAEIRREVVAQALDYVSALTTMSYTEFEAAVARGQGAPERIYDLFHEHPDALEEPQFIDAVAAKLARGRLLVLILGDGIRSETEALANLLQSHAGAHFTFALVEMATWRTGSGSILVVPDTLTKTVMIERGIVRVTGAGIEVEPVPPEAKPRAQSLSMRDFMGLMAGRNPALPRAIETFLDALEPLGVFPDLKASLSLKIELADFPTPLNLGYINKEGQFWTDMLSSRVSERVWRPYLQTISRIVGGEIREAKISFAADRSGRAPRIEQLLPEHHEELVAAIEAIVHHLRRLEV